MFVHCSSCITVDRYVCCFLYYLSFYLDINECELDGLNDCDGNADCIDTIGSYNCSCISGYEGDGFNCTGDSHVMHMEM